MIIYWSHTNTVNSKDNPANVLSSVQSFAGDCCPDLSTGGGQPGLGKEAESLNSAKKLTAF